MIHPSAINKVSLNPFKPLRVKRERGCAFPPLVDWAMHEIYFLWWTFVYIEFRD